MMERHLRGAGSARTIQQHMDGRFTLSAGAVSEKDNRFYDTFDWRLFHEGLLLVWTEGTWQLAEIETGNVLARQTGPAGVRFASCRGDVVECPPRSVLSRGGIAPFLRERLGNRRVILVLHERESCVAHTLRDQRGKSHGTVELVEWRAASTTRRGGRRVKNPKPHCALVFHPLRGYRDSRDLLLEAISGHGQEVSRSALMEQRFGTADAAPGYHQTKPDVQRDTDDPAAVAVSRIGCHLLRIMEEQVPGIVLRIDAEYLHDYRVALRRLRSVVSNVPGVFPADVEVAIRSRLRQLWQRTGPARDLDVLEESWEHYAETVSSSLRPGIDDLSGFTVARRIEAYADLGAYVCTGTHDADLRILTRAFESVAHDYGSRGGRPVHGEAGAALRRRIKKVRRRARKLDVTDETALHGLRVQCKKLRYLLEVFGPLYDDVAVATLTHELKRVQEVLGRVNDYAVQQETLARFLDEVPDPAPRTAAAVGAVITRLEDRKRREQKRLRKKLQRHLGELERPQWRALFETAEEPL